MSRRRASPRPRPAGLIRLLVLLGFFCLFAPTGSPAEAKSRADGNLATAFVEIAKKNVPAVVHIEVIQQEEVSIAIHENNPLFNFFDLPKDRRKFRRELKGLGTGMILDSRGYIMTSSHVVSGAKAIRVLLADGRQFAGRLVGNDPRTDLAVIKVASAESLPHVVFGDSDKMEVGEWVVAIGHPRGLDQTVTQGIVSAKHRQGITDPASYQDFLQTDAAINPGNSGGPLLNLHGEVVGVASAIVSQSGGFEGIGFAVPSNMARYIAGELIAHGKIVRGWLGVSIEDLPASRVQSFGLSAPKGALVADVMPGSPAAGAGIRKGDLILSYGGKEIPNASTLRNRVAMTSVGQEKTLRLQRDHHVVEATARIGSLEEAGRMFSARARERLGADFGAVPSEIRNKYGLNPGQGVEVRNVDPKGTLGEAGIENEDILLEVNGLAIGSAELFAETIVSMRSRQRIILIILDHRSGEVGYVGATLK